MDWFAPIDIYCERTAPGFWDEPFNALTNAAFLIAAAAAYARAGAEARRDPAVIGLTLTVVATGIGSFLFHTYAQVWSMLADTGAITVFVCWYLGFALRRFLAVSWPQMLLAVAAMLAAGLAADLLVPRGTLNGSVGYLPPLAALAAVGAVLARRGHPAAAHLAVAACVFAVSLALRTVDNAVCTAWPAGTHMAWHVLNALVLFLALDAAARFGVAGRTARGRAGSSGSA